MIYLRNTHPTQRLAVPVSRGLTRLLWPGVTSRVPAAVLDHSAVQALLDQQRVQVITECLHAPGARERLRRDMQAAIAQAERAEFAKLLVRQQRQRHVPPAAVIGGRAPRSQADDEWLREQWLAGTPRAVIGRHLGITGQGVGMRAKTLGLRPHPRCFRSPR
jgi:hypothetical protein